MLFEIEECDAVSNYNEMMAHLEQVLQANDTENSNPDVCLIIINVLYFSILKYFFTLK